MADSQINISLSIADNAAQKVLDSLTSKAGSTDKAFQKLGDTGSGTFNDIAVSIGKATGVYDIFAGNLAANVAEKAIETLIDAAHTLFDTFIVEGVKAAEDNETAINALNVALAASGQYSKETSDDFIEFADQLQNTTKFSHDAIIQNAALIESLTQLGPGALKTATQAALDLAAATGKDLPAASELVAKAANGQITGLTRLGIVVQQGTTNAETFANALAQIEGRFSGAAEGQINTYSGAVAQMGNSFRDVQEQVGNLIVQNPVVIAVLQSARAIFDDLSTAIKTNSQQYLLLVGQGISSFLTVSAAVVTAVDASVRVFQTLYGVVQALSAPFLVLTVPIRALSVGLTQATEEMTAFAKSATDNLTAFGKSGDGALSTVATDLLKMRDSANAGLTALANGAKTSVEPINSTAGKVEELTAEMKQAEAQALSFAASLIKAASDGKTASADEVKLAKATADAQDAINQQLLASKQIDDVEYAKRKQALDAQYLKVQQQAVQQEYAKENDMLDTALASGKQSDTQYWTARNELADEYLAKQAINNQKIVADDAKTKEALRKAEITLVQNRLQFASDTFSGLASLTQTKSRELFEIGKAAAIANAIVNTAQGITLALANYVWPYSLIPAAAIAVAGGVQVDQILSTSPSFESGGIVPGNSYSGDNVTANVNSGEMILNRAQQSTLFNIANGAGQTSQIDYRKVASAIAAGIGSQPIHVHIGGKTIVSTLRNELKGGRTFA